MLKFSVLFPFNEVGLNKSTLFTKHYSLTYEADGCLYFKEELRRRTEDGTSTPHEAKQSMN